MKTRWLIAAATIWCSAAAAQDYDPNEIAEGLTAGDTAAIQEARSDAIGYLSQPRLSVSDRLAAEGALRAAIDEAIGSGDEFRTVNALLVAGFLVTPTSLQSIEPMLADERPGVRYAAYKAMRESMNLLSGQASPSLQPQAALDAFGRLTEAAAGESDPANIEAGLRAIAAATSMRANALRPLADRAAVALPRVAGEQLGRLDAGDGEAYRAALGAVLFAVLDLRTSLSDRNARFTDDAVRGAADLGGRLVQHVYQAYEDAGSIAEIDEPRRNLLAQALAAGEALVYFAVVRLDDDTEQTQVASSFRSGDDRTFRAGVLRIIGPAGVLQKNGIAVTGG